MIVLLTIFIIYLKQVILQNKSLIMLFINPEKIIIYLLIINKISHLKIINQKYTINEFFYLYLNFIILNFTILIYT